MSSQNLSLPIKSRLPHTETTIFSIMSALAEKHQAINLGQGFPDFDCDPALINFLEQALYSGNNQYAPMPGISLLRQAISNKISNLYGHDYDAEQEITITAGATQALFTAILCSVQPGDEVVIIEPAYDSYVPAILLAGGIPVFVSMTNEYRIDWDILRVKINPRTRLLIINSPHNPSGTVFSRNDIQALELLVERFSFTILSDEVYEHMVFDNQTHLSLSSSEILARRSFVISSFGKTYHITGWKIGYCAAPTYLMKEFRKVHQFNVFTVNTPMQYGIAHYMQNSSHYQHLAKFYQIKRDYLRKGLANTPFKILPCEGTYFQLVQYSDIKPMPDIDFAKWLTREIGVATIPLSAFYHSKKDQHIIRLCFAKKSTTLDIALERLNRLSIP